MLQTAQVIPPQPALAGTELSVFHTLLYFDLFRHPLTTDEIHRNCQWSSASLSEVAAALEALREMELIGTDDAYWFLAGSEHHVKIREERMERAARFMKKAKRYSALISSFPFVKAVFISGSLSKGTLDRDGDIDYFIVTDPGRLWIARTLLVLYKKVFLLNSKKYFCVNYFVDSVDMSIPDRNLFVATEIAHLLPMRGGKLCVDFREVNHWTTLFYPNNSSLRNTEFKAVRSTWMRRGLERFLQGNFGNWLEKKFWIMTVKRWKRKFPEVPPEIFENRFRSRKSVSKHHPNGYQQRVASALETRRKQIVGSTGIPIPALPWEWMTNDQA